jgi:hypothetical protein
VKPTLPQLDESISFIVGLAFSNTLSKAESDGLPEVSPSA